MYVHLPAVKAPSPNYWTTREFPEIFFLLKLLKCKIHEVIKYGIQTGFPGGPVVKNLPVLTGDTRDVVSVFGWERSPGGRAWQLSLVLLPGECHGQTSLAGYNPWGRKELDMTEHTSVDTDSVKNFFFILCIYLFMFGCAESSLPRGLFLL